MTRLPSASPSGGRAAIAAATPAGFIGRYQILEKIGEGGMGSLYLARDPAIDRLIALKLLRRGFDTVELRERFSREARAAGRLRHPNIVTIFDVGEHDGDPFIAMEFLAGETLDELSRHGARLSLVRRLTLIEELCEGLAYAHRAGIVHRDIKPANLMVDSEGVVKILDFGIVRLDEGRVTQSGMLVGTVNYMSPEQVTGSDVDHRSDIFAVGLVAYELICGRQAFPGALKDGLFNRILNVDFEPLSKAAPDLDPEAASIIEQALRKDPADRYQDLARMRNDLQRVRRRLEADEDLAVQQLAADSGETLMATSPVPTPAAGTPPKSSPGLEAAERALASGDFRAALTLAGRSAAAEPRNRAASAVMARAQAGLLERARALESSASIAKPGTGAAGGSGSSGAITPSGTVQTAHLPIAMIVAAVVLAGGLVAAAMLLSNRGDTPPPSQTDAGDAPATVQAPASIDSSPSGSASGPPAAAAEPPAAPPVSVDPKKPAEESRNAGGGRQPQTNPPAPSRDRTPPTRESAEPAAPSPSAPAILRVGRDGIEPPRRARFVPPDYPAAGPRMKGVVAVELTVGRDGRVADARVIGGLAAPFDRAALEAVRQWEYVPTQVDGKPVAVIFPVDVPFTPPEIEKPLAPEPAVTPPAAPPSKEPARQPQAQTPPKQAAAPRDENAAIRGTLRQYGAAWEARDADAIARVHALSAGDLATVRAALRGAERYEMDIKVQSVQIDPAGRKATVTCSMSRAYDPKVGEVQRATTNNTVELEKRGDNWMITTIK